VEWAQDIPEEALESRSGCLFARIDTHSMLGQVYSLQVWQTVLLAIPRAEVKIVDCRFAKGEGALDLTLLTFAPTSSVRE
jgi:hypothetical protein